MDWLRQQEEAGKSTCPVCVSKPNKPSLGIVKERGDLVIATNVDVGDLTGGIDNVLETRSQHWPNRRKLIQHTRALVNSVAHFSAAAGSSPRSSNDR